MTNGGSESFPVESVNTLGDAQDEVRAEAPAPGAEFTGTEDDLNVADRLGVFFSEGRRNPEDFVAVNSLFVDRMIEINHGIDEARAHNYIGNETELINQLYLTKAGFFAYFGDEAPKRFSGLMSEVTVSLAFEKLGFEVTSATIDEDRAGIDLIAHTKDGLVVPMQVKSKFAKVGISVFFVDAPDWDMELYEDKTLSPVQYREHKQEILKMREALISYREGLNVNAEMVVAPIYVIIPSATDRNDSVSDPLTGSPSKAFVDDLRDVFFEALDEKYPYE